MLDIRDLLSLLDCISADVPLRDADRRSDDHHRRHAEAAGSIATELKIFGNSPRPT